MLNPDAIPSQADEVIGRLARGIHRSLPWLQQRPARLVVTDVVRFPAVIGTFELDAPFAARELGPRAEPVLVRPGALGPVGWRGEDGGPPIPLPIPGIGGISRSADVRHSLRVVAEGCCGGAAVSSTVRWVGERQAVVSDLIVGTVPEADVEVDVRLPFGAFVELLVRGDAFAEVVSAVGTVDGSVRAMSAALAMVEPEVRAARAWLRRSPDGWRALLAVGHLHDGVSRGWLTNVARRSADTESFDPVPPIERMSAARLPDGSLLATFEGPELGWCDDAVVIGNLVRRSPGVDVELVDVAPTGVRRVLGGPDAVRELAGDVGA